ncbi:hypothetical protein ACHAW5_007485 [Stephanodiscus triporus]|uniref:Peptidase M50 domain-containing protein n=1 Tax=Stephanodiscus triporus TaxID=2934178 RepID=A0ABD3NNG8_9STRA
MRLSAGIIGLLHALSSPTAPSHAFRPSSPEQRRDVVRRRHSSSSSRSPPAPPPPYPSSFPSSSSSSSSSFLGATTNPVEVLSAIASPVGSVSVLAFVILVHEAGHFLAARSMGMRVDEFSVGIGPRLLGVRRRSVDGGGFVYERIVDDGDDYDYDDEGTEGSARDGIEFSLRAIPLGGYVRFPENYNRTLALEREDAARRARNEARSMRIEGSTPVERALEYMAASSFVLNAASLGSLGRWQSRRAEEQLRRAEEEIMESRSNMLSKFRGDASSWWYALPWVANKKGDGGGKGSSGDEDDELTILRAAATEPTIDYFDDPDLLQNRPWHQRAIVLSGGVVFNILLAFACYLGELSVGRGLPSPVFGGGAVVDQMPGKDSPAHGLLKRGDVILGVNDVVTSPSGTADSHAGAWASQREISNVISAIRETPDGESVRLTIVHGRDGTGKSDVISVNPRRDADGLASIGVMLSPNYLRTDMVRASSVVDAVTKAGTAVYDLTSETAKSIVGLLIGILFGKGLPPGTSMSGPIGVVRTGAEVVGTSDIWAVVAFAASISVNLAVVNSLPLPALDGGQLAFVLAEAAAGRRIDQRVQEGINAGALLILLFISFGTAVGDVTSIFR